MVQRPYVTELAMRTSINDTPSGERYAYGWRGAGVAGMPTTALRRASWTYDCVSAADVATLQAFFDSMRGRRGEFTFLNPAGNLVQVSESYSGATWERNGVTVGGATSGPYSGAGAVNCVSSSSNASLVSTVLPDGGASGYILTASAWVRPASPQSLAIGFVDSGFGVVGSLRTHQLAAGSWARIWCSATVATALPIRLIIGGLGTWTSGQSIDVFGAQAVANVGLGEYAATPAGYGYWPKCRFDMDALSVRWLGKNHASVVPIEIVEVA